MPCQSRLVLVVVLPLLLGCTETSGPVVAAVSEASTVAAVPTTVAEAAAKLDLVTLPLPVGAEMSGYRREAELGYTIKGPSKDAFEFVDKQLVERGWKQLGDPQQSGDFASADYQQDGYLVHLSVFPQQPGVTHVTLSHQGNVALGSVPVPDNAEKLYDFPAIIMYKSPDGVDETAKACREKMLAAGWSPYGGAGDTAYYRKNAVRADVRVMSAPAQDNATMISISCTMQSLELPSPPFTENFRYTDGTTAIGFDTDKTPQEVAAFYREKLSPVGWKATTEKPFAIEWKEYTIFRNEGQAMITIATHEFEGRTRVHLDHQNASEVAGEELRERIAAGEKAKYRDKKWLTVEVRIPAGLEVKQIEDWAVKIPISAKDPFATANAIAESLIAAGWKAEAYVDRPVIRSRQFTGQDRVLHLIAIKPEKREPWIALVGVGGVKLRVAE